MASPTQSKSASEGPTPSPVPPSDPTSSNNFEMNDLDDSKRQTGSASQHLNDISIPTTSPITSDFLSTDSTAPTGTENTKPASGSAEPAANDSVPATRDFASKAGIATGESYEGPPTVITKLDSVAIGAANTLPTPTVGNDGGPVLLITLLLSSTGARHPYKIDEKYLIKRAVNVPGQTENDKPDPLSISVYTLKELILREWRPEWEAKPSSPSSIRLIYFGRLLDDKTALKECRFNADSANVVHMTVRPQDVVDEEEQSKGKALRGETEGAEETAGCRCVIL